MTKTEIVAALAEHGIVLKPSQIRKSSAATLQARLDAIRPHEAPASAENAPPSVPAPKPKRRRGTNIAAKRDFKPFRDGTKQAAMFALMTRPEGATMDDLAAVVPNWKPGTVKSSFHWDFAAQHGVGVRTTFDGDTARYHAVVTEATA